MYSKDTKSKDRPVCPETQEILKRFVVAPKGFMSDEDIQMRIASRFVNDAVLCLQDGILANPVSCWSISCRLKAVEKCCFICDRLKVTSVPFSALASLLSLVDPSVSSTNMEPISWWTR